jgi:hypothetical protein
MPLTLVATPGSATANSYATVEEADTYHEGRLFSSWADADPDVKISALVMAARLLDATPGAWTGAPTDAVQALGWPRIGMLSRNGFALLETEIPVDLKNAQAEYADQLIASNITATNDAVAQGISRVKAGPVEVTFKEGLTQETAMAAMLPDAVRLLLVPSWLIDPREAESAFSGLVFESL